MTVYNYDNCDNCESVHQVFMKWVRVIKSTGSLVRILSYNKEGTPG